ncbi:hypothetical protein [Flagellimonas sp. CMM7]|uniref:hypothetical protein n=1 Tax=Flagellimonas sp. CMM7 TaxID=2654676 RepID=UPI0013D4C081|nr:hypothetical protein [Flagellimonas sp. CMM7]UII81507.1 hypothetical protein LV704_08300 [Flagellimonas sp. CMM7]
MKDFRRKVIKTNEIEKQNLIKEFGNLSNNVNQLKLDLNAKLDPTFNLADVVDFIENPKSLETLFKEVEKSAIKQRAKNQGVTLAQLEQLENVELNKQQLDFLARANKLKGSNLFAKGMTSEDWLVNNEIKITEKVDEVFTALTTTYTSSEQANDRLELVELFNRYIDKYGDSHTIKRILTSGNRPNLDFINYGIQ